MSTSQAPIDALEFLAAERYQLQERFAEFRALHEAQPRGLHAAKQRIMDDVCMSLKILLRLQEELLFPPARKSIFGMETVLRDANAEHMGMRYFIAQVEAGSADNALTCSRFLVLAEQIDHYREREDTELFPRIRQSKLDRHVMGVAMDTRRNQLLAELSRGHAGSMDRHTSAERHSVQRAAH